MKKVKPDAIKAKTVRILLFSAIISIIQCDGPGAADFSPDPHEQTKTAIPAGKLLILKYLLAKLGWESQHCDPEPLIIAILARFAQSKAIRIKRNHSPKPLFQLTSTLVTVVTVDDACTCQYHSMKTTHQDVLNYWFGGDSLDSPKLDGRMKLWFNDNISADKDMAQRFAAPVKSAIRGQLNDWAKTPEGRLALILLLDQFTRRIYYGRRDAYAGDTLALQLCAKGASCNMHKGLSPIQRLFFFMPLQRAESEKIQARSVQVYKAMVPKVSGTLHATFETFAMIAELRHDVIAEHGRFPHRNVALGRETSKAEAAASTTSVAA